MNATQIEMLKKLQAQTIAAEQNPGAYSAFYAAGEKGCHAGTARALIARGMVDTFTHAHLGLCITMNDKGRAALVQS